MIKKIFLLLILFSFNWALGQKSLEHVLNEIKNDKSYSSTFGYSDRAGEISGISIQNAPLILERLGLEEADFGEYYLTGKYEINSLSVLFVSKYWETEDIHFALLLDQSLNLIDRLDETAYENAEGFYSVTTYIDYNILETTTFNDYNPLKYTRKKYTITRDGFKVVEDEVVVDHPAGCSVYKEPSVDSATLTWANQFDRFSYLGQEYEMNSEKLAEDGYLRASWYELAEKGSLDRFGYIFVGCAKRHIEFITDDYKMVVKEISEEVFQMEEVKRRKNPEVHKITDVEQIDKLLGKQLILEYNEEYEYHEIKEIVADNGKKIVLYWPDYSVLAYFPDDHYLLLEGGHSTDHIINMKNGDHDIERIGNPDHYLISPNGTFCIKGYYGGQSFTHFVEKSNIDGETEYLFSLSSILNLDFIETYFWKDDNTLILKIEGDYYCVQILSQ